MLINYPRQEISTPAGGWFIFFSLIFALLLNFLPLDGIFLLLRPDFAALIMLYWSIHQPQHVGLSVAFGMGLLMDVSNTGILGQHALAYCVIGYFALVLNRRLSIFNTLQQAPQIGIFLLFIQLIILLTGLINGYSFPGWGFFLSCITGLLVWPLMSFLLQIFHQTGRNMDTL